MKIYIGWAAVILIIFTACTVTEEVQVETETAPPIEEETVVPSWYNPGIHSTSDSLSFQGFALASAMDSTRAVELSTQTAMNYLRFEIDKATEETRKQLEEDTQSGEDYRSSSFIIKLRNAVSDLSLSAADLELKHEEGEGGIHYSYAKASISRTELPDLLRGSLNNSIFLDKLTSVSQ